MALGFGVSAGKLLDTRRLDIPLISGLHLSLGLVLCQLHFFIGVDALISREPDLKFLKLE